MTLTRVFICLASVLVGLAGCMLGLSTLGLIALGSDGAHCWENGHDVASPTGQWIARTSMSGCPGLGGDSIKTSVSVRRGGHSASAAKDIFVSSQEVSDISWDTDSHLIITIRAVSEIEKSELTYEGVDISYEVPFDYSEEAFRAKEAEYRRRVEERLSAGTSTFTNDSEKDFIYLQKQLERQRKTDQIFHDWAENIVRR